MNEKTASEHGMVKQVIKYITLENFLNFFSAENL